MDNRPNPLAYHYDTALKLDHFLLGADVVILGWTIVNVDWLPPSLVFASGILLFWALIFASLVLGILRQRYSSEAFGVNFMDLNAGELADVIERSSLQGGAFVNQQTGETISAEEFKKYATVQRDNQKMFKKAFNVAADKAALLGRWTFYLLAIGLGWLAILKFLSMVS